MKKTMKLDKDKLPKHIAFIVDGNRRWAKENNLSANEGHKKGAQVVLRVMEDCLELGIPVLTFYIFSTENWNRSKREVNFLMKFGMNFLKKKIDYINSKDIKIRIIGRIAELEGNLKKSLHYAEELTKNNKKMVLNLAINYGGRIEIVDAVNSILQKGDIRKVDEATFAEHIYTAGLPDPDLLIRTGGDYRVSNFLLWQIAYTEIVIIPELWPDLSKEKLYEAIAEYQRRQRRWGK
jgi:undecaprenyl diphosphate synthase